jgi:hypothetical protein
MARIAQINLRARPSLKAKLEKLAKHDRRTLSAYVEKLAGGSRNRTRASSGEVGVQRTNSDAESLVCMTRLILKAIDVGASAVFMTLCAKAFVFTYSSSLQRDLFNQPDHPRPPSSY